MDTKRQLVIGNEVTKAQKFSYDTTKVLLASLLIGLCGILSFNLPFTSVPVTFQVNMVLLVSAVLGSRKAFLATAAFLLQGAMGWPVFSSGHGGFHHFLGPTGGYLLGYLIAAYVTGLIVEKIKHKTALKLFLSFLAGTLIVYICGVSMLGNFIGLANAILLGVVPFILGDIFKSLIITKAYQKVMR